MKRIVMQNFYLQFSEKEVILINIISYRREKISIDEFQILKRIEEKITQKIVLSDDESKLYNKLFEQKQILPDDLIEKYINETKEFCENGRIENLAITQAIINLSYKCNFKCVYCYQKNYHNHSNRILPKDIPLIHNFINDYNRCNKKVDKIIISGGEPLLHENRNTIYSIFEEFNDASFELFTNGTLLDKTPNDVIDRIDSYQVSLDGDDETIKYVNKYDSKNSFEKILKSIFNLAEMNKKITIVCMLTKAIDDNYRKFFNLIINSKLLDNDNVKMQINVPSNFSTEGYFDSLLYDSKDFLDIYKGYKDFLSGTKIQIGTLYQLKTLQAVLRREKNERLTPSVASCFFNKGIPPVFGPDGMVYWCTCIKENALPIGSYRSKSMIYTDNLNQFTLRSVFSFEKCQKCQMKFLCGSGCPLPLVKEGNAMQPYCGVYNDEYIMDHIEDII